MRNNTKRRGRRTRGGAGSGETDLDMMRFEGRSATRRDKLKARKLREIEMLLAAYQQVPPYFSFVCLYLFVSVSVLLVLLCLCVHA